MQTKKEIQSQLKKSDTPIVQVTLKPIGHYEPGTVLRVKNHEYIVLKHCPGKDLAHSVTALISKDIISKMEFGSDGNYLNSNIVTYLEHEYYNEICDIFGKINIVKHTIQNTDSKAYVSLLTVNDYIAYRHYLPPCSNWWWTSTGVLKGSSDQFTNRVQFIDANGDIDWCSSSDYGGVRPFFMVKSNLLIGCSD